MKKTMILFSVLSFLFSFSYTYAQEDIAICDEVHEISQQIGNYYVDVQVCHNPGYQDCWILGTVSYKGRNLWRMDTRAVRGYRRMEWLSAPDNYRGFKMYYYPETREVKYERGRWEKGKWKWSEKYYWMTL